MMKFSRFFIALIASAPLFAQAAHSFNSTADGKALDIPDAMFDTPAAKQFLNTGKNPYIGDAVAAKAGKKVYQLYSCSQCHGPNGDGQVGPNLRDDTWNYAKNATDKGIFETIWAGTAGGMGAKGKGLMQPDDATQGLTPDEILKVVGFLRTSLDAKPAETSAEPAKTAEATPAVATTDAAPVATTKPAVKSKKVKNLRKAKKLLSN